MGVRRGGIAAARDLNLHENVLRKWAREQGVGSWVGVSRSWRDEIRAAGDL